MHVSTESRSNTIARYSGRAMACALGLVVAAAHPALAHASTDPTPAEAPAGDTATWDEPASNDSAATESAEPPAPTVTADTTPTPVTAQPTPRHEENERKQRKSVIVGSTLTGIGLAMGVGAGLLGHFALNPTCTDANDPTTCISGFGNSKQRAGMLGGSAAMSIGGAVMSGLGGRHLGRSAAYEGQSGATRSDVGRKSAIGTGAVGIALGGAGIIAGAALIGAGVPKALDVPEVNMGSDPYAVMDQFEENVKGVKMVRSGYAALVVAPSLLAVGVGLLKNARRKSSASASAWNLTPQVGAGFAGMQSTIHF